MTTPELIQLADLVRTHQAEFQTIEVKAAHQGCPHKLYDTLSSFSNQDEGGTILFGLDEKTGFAPVGIYDAQDLQKQVTEQCNQMEPPVRAFFTIAEYAGVTICSAEIPAVDYAERPCYYKGKGRSTGSYLRVGDADLVMTDLELYSYEAFRRHLHDDERQVPRASLSQFDQNALESYLLKRRMERPGFSRLSSADTYEMLNITRGGEPTLAAVLNFSIYPQAFFPQLCITAVVVPGSEIGCVDENSARFLDNKRIEGTIKEMLAGALEFCTRNMKVQTVVDPSTGARADRTEYPINAIREALLNALIHRDYSNFTEGTPIQLDFFQDRLEIHSPGALYGRMTVDQLGHTRPDLRNPTLATMTEALTGAENRYSGIPTIRRELQEAGLPAPVFENRRNEFVVTFYNKRTVPAPAERPAEQDRASDLLTFCQTPRTRKELSEFLGIKSTFYAMQHYVIPLVTAGKLAMTLPDTPRSRNQKFYTV